MRITLNLATRPFNDIGPSIKRLRIGIAILAALCLLFILGLHLFDSQAADARALEHSLDGKIAGIQAERQQAQALMQQPDNALLLNQAEFLNERFDEKAFSWTLAMEAMETVLPAGVQVTSIEPQPTGDGHIKVELRVIGPHDRSIDLVRNLEHSRRFLDPRIEGESAESSTGLNQQQAPVNASNRFDFELFAEYNPPAPGERATEKNAALKSTPLRHPATNSKPPASAPAVSPHPGAFPAAPTGRGHPPFTGTVQMPPHPAPAANGGPQ